MKLLFEQAKSAMSSYDSAQDSLDKAYLTIMFGNIAFYATKIKPPLNNLGLDLMSVAYMGVALILILVSFMLSKSMMHLFYNNTLFQIEHLNWQIPFMVFLSSCLCFIKASIQNAKTLMIIDGGVYFFYGIWGLGGIIIYCWVKGKQNVKTSN